MHFSRGSSRPRDRTHVHLLHFLTWQEGSLPLALPGKPSGSLSKFHILKKVKVKSLSRVRLFVTPWTVDCQAPLSREFSRQGYWRGFLFPSPGDLSKPGIDPGSPALQAYALPSELLGKPSYLLSLILLEWNPWVENLLVLFTPESPMS